MPDERAKYFPCIHIPHLNGIVHVSTRDCLIIGGERHSKAPSSSPMCMPKCVQMFTRLGIPQAKESVRTGTYDCGSIGRASDPPDLLNIRRVCRKGEFLSEHSRLGGSYREAPR